MPEPCSARNFFALFGFPESFDLDIAELAERYRSLARQFHPDRFAQSAPAEQRLSLEMTATLNEGLQTLRDPIARARYLLELKGVDTGEETDTKMSSAFLMTQMELREQLADVRQARDSQRQLDTVRQHAEDELLSRTRILQTAFSDGSTSALQDARNAMREMQFLRKLLNEIELIDNV